MRFVQPKTGNGRKIFLGRRNDPRASCGDMPDHLEGRAEQTEISTGAYAGIAFGTVCVAIRKGKSHVRQIHSAENGPVHRRGGTERISLIIKFVVALQLHAVHACDICDGIEAEAGRIECDSERLDGKE